MQPERLDSGATGTETYRLGSHTTAILTSDGKVATATDAGGGWGDDWEPDEDLERDRVCESRRLARRFELTPECRRARVRVRRRALRRRAGQILRRPRERRAARRTAARRAAGARSGNDPGDDDPGPRTVVLAYAVLTADERGEVVA